MTRPTLDEIRNEDGTLPPVVWPGGYPVIYLDGDNLTLCAICASEDEVHDAPAVSWFIHYEGSPVVCEGCSVEIESAYGDPDADPFKDYHGPNADDGTKLASKHSMSVDRNFRVTIHPGYSTADYDADYNAMTDEERAVGQGLVEDDR